MNATENGALVPDGSNTRAMEYSGGKVYGQDATTHQWYPWNQTTWTGPVPAPSGPVSVTGTAGADTVNLTGNSQPALITLGSGASTVQYALQASSGIETIGNFQLGLDALNINLLGAASTSLKAFDTTVNGAKAIAVASSADLAHGVVWLNIGNETASDLLAAHTTFNSGHALIS